ncbi:ATP-binding cassette domain-containing protein [Crossiella cryophila]|uniref:ATP-binding cassette subfamily C protein n=1 Tax=Crossiella cryophila TaxID=43355 RepID=A0A7W7CEG3_9PSEU|nr:ABC transporter ATP-binding protein [Crossiella cryophila]MBB4679663.1 ATP-binding cassette subfamily C protein [Crossiella cryophila]
MTNPGRRLLVAELSQRRAPLLRIAAWSVPEALPALLSGLLVSQALDQGFLRGQYLTGLVWLEVLLLVVLAGLLATRAIFPQLAAVVEPLRDSLVRRLVSSTVHRSVAEIDRGDNAGLARLVELAEGIRQLTAGLLRTLRPLLLRLIAACAGLIALAPAATPLLLAPLVPAGIGVWLLLPRLARCRRELVVQEEEIGRSSALVFAGVRDVVASGGVDRARAEIDHWFTAHARSARRMTRLHGLLTLVISLGAQAPVFLLLLLAPWLTGGGHTTVGELVGAVTYAGMTLAPAVGELAGTISGPWLQLEVVLRRLAEVTEPVEQAAVPAQRRPAPRGADLALRQVTFRYGSHSVPVLDNLDLDVPHGDHLVVAGASGIGKSTLATLLTGVRSPQGGLVTLAGTPVGELDPATVRSRIAFIPQEAYVFAGTLWENLGYLHPAVTEQELDTAVDAVGLRELVDRLGGYDAGLGPCGVQLSAGEGQQVALARVYLSSADIVVLDEATCHLDPEAEARAEAAFVARGGTLVVIAHRISSAVRARRVLLLDGSRVHLGTHERLLETTPAYAALVGHWRASSAGAAHDERAMIPDPR